MAKRNVAKIEMSDFYFKGEMKSLREQMVS